QTKPLTFADCIGDELPVGWEEAYDPHIGAYYVDHNTKSTQVEDPRVQWQREQERMLREYLAVARDALSTQQETYQVKEQRLRLAQQEYRQLSDAWKDKSASQTSLNSRSSSSSKYDPEILKAEIVTAKSRVNKLKRDLACMKQELQYKEQGFETLREIGHRVSGASYEYKLQEAQAVLNEVKSIKDAISLGEKEKRELMQKLAILKDGFRLDSGSLLELWASSSPSLADSSLSIPRLYSDAESQTDIPAETNSLLAEKVRLSLKYEEAKRRIANLEVQIAKLDSQAWPGLLDPERDRLILISEKEELLKELQYAKPCARAPGDAEKIETEKRRLEMDLQAARDSQSKALTERLRLHCRRSKLVRELEETVRLASSLHTQLKSLSASTLSCSSGSSHGSLTSSRGSLATSSLGSSSSLSLSELCVDAPELADPELRHKLDSLLQEGAAAAAGYRPPSSIPTIHENEVVGAGGCPRVRALRPLGTPPRSAGSLSPRSSLSSLSPPCSPLVTDAGFLQGDVFLGSELHGRLAELHLRDDGLVGDTRGTGAKEGTGASTAADAETSKGNADCVADARGPGPGVKKAGVSSAVSDESVAGDSGVYEPSEKRPGHLLDLLTCEDGGPSGSAKVRLGLKYVRVVVLPCLETTRCLFRTRGVSPWETVDLNEVFGVQVSHSALRQKTLRVDVCYTNKLGKEECLAGAQISLAEISSSGERSTKWYNLLNYTYVSDIDAKHREAKTSPEQEQGSLEMLELSTTGGTGENVEGTLELKWHSDAVEGDVFEDREESDAEEEELVEEEEGLYPDSRQWEGEEEEVEKLVCAGSNIEKLNKETTTEGLSKSVSVVRPKERRSAIPQHNPFVRGNTIIRSKTFSPGPQSQYVCRINRSDSDSSTLSKKSPFVRNASERRSVRLKKPPLQARGLDGLLRTSLDLELDLQASRTRRARLEQELRVLRQLKEQMEEARLRGCSRLPACVREDERLCALLQQLDRQTKEEQLQEARVERMMRAVAKDVQRIRGQSRKEVPEVQSFREKMAFFTRAKINIPDLPADDV
ncbi:protein KIBRA-like, partial [Scleropages formosus]